MIIISYDNKLVGGLGDRIVGLISCKLLAKLLNRKFYISWTKENIQEYIDYSKYDYEIIDKNNNLNIKYHNYIDNQQGLKNYLMNETELFLDDINIFNLNQEIAQYLYKNKLFTEQDYYTDIFYEYQTLYTDILKPTDSLTKKINFFVKDKKNIVGIQIRAGDSYMPTNKGENEKNFNNLEDDIISILKNIKLKCDSTYENYNIFLTSDYSDIYRIASNIWQSENIIYNHDIIQHIDRKPVNNDISKIFVDNIILSQHTCEIYISKGHNYGRIAALSSRHNNIYDLYCNTLDKKILVSKHDIVG